MAKNLFGVHRKVDEVYPEAKQRQKLRRCTIELSSHSTHATDGKLMSFPKRKNKNYTKKHLQSTMFLFISA